MDEDLPLEPEAMSENEEKVADPGVEEGNFYTDEIAEDESTSQNEEDVQV